MKTAGDPSVLIMAGGTGGHIFPGLALAHCLQEKGWAVAWLGTPKGMEVNLVPQSGFVLHTMAVEGLRGKGWQSWLGAPFRLLRALIQALSILHRLKPDVVVGMGGFVSGPGGIAAWLLRIPLVIHEQNAIAGTTNRCLAPLARTVMAGFPHSFRPSVPAIYTGNPVRQVFMTYPHPHRRFQDREGPLKLLIVGGSRGARVLNDRCPLAIQTLPESLRPLIWHQTGQADSVRTRAAYEEAGISAKVEPFIADIAKAYAWADLVVCRAGALTLAELAALGLGSILVPFPFAVDDHQRFNARFLEEAGAAHIILEADLSVDRLAKGLGDLLSNPQSLKTMAEAAYAVSKRDALVHVARLCEEVLNVKGA